MINTCLKPVAKLPILLLFIIIQSCEPGPSNDQPESNIVKDEEGKIISGEIIKYFQDGKIAELMNFKNYKLDGKAVKYYEDGITKRSELNYSRGSLEGVQKRYYKSGALYKEEMYVEDKRHGLTKKFREGGQLMSEAYYKHGFAGANLVEYLTDGTLKKKYPKIVIEEEYHLELDGSVIIKIFLSDKSKKVKFYLGVLDEDNFLNDNLDLQYTSKKGVLTINIFLQPGESAQGEYHIVAKVVTRLNNVYITTKKHKVSIRFKPN